ncbi:hypothetical protein D3C78_1923570 [compost metagenome]
MLLAGSLQVVELLGGEELQGVQLGVVAAAAQHQALLGAVLGDAPLGDQLAQDVVEIQPAILGRRG